jgi:hypothetical protein
MSRKQHKVFLGSWRGPGEMLAPASRKFACGRPLAAALIIGISANGYGASLPNKTAASIEEQQQCSRVAHAFYSHYPKMRSGWRGWHTNHYNTQLNKCFILITSQSETNDSLTIDLFDSLENKHYAAYVEHMYVIQKCFILPILDTVISMLATFGRMATIRQKQMRNSVGRAV